MKIMSAKSRDLFGSGNNFKAGPQKSEKCAMCDVALGPCMQPTLEIA